MLYKVSTSRKKDIFLSESSKFPMKLYKDRSFSKQTLKDIVKHDHKLYSKKSNRNLKRNQFYAILKKENGWELDTWDTWTIQVL